MTRSTRIDTRALTNVQQVFGTIRLIRAVFAEEAGQMGLPLSRDQTVRAVNTPYPPGTRQVTMSPAGGGCCAEQVRLVAVGGELAG